jgi:hypothetical protein
VENGNDPVNTAIFDRSGRFIHPGSGDNRPSVKTRFSAFHRPCVENLIFSGKGRFARLKIVDVRAAKSFGRRKGFPIPFSIKL